jgi:LysM repeat protein
VAAAPPAPPEPQARQPESPAPAIHTVAAGESLADLASRYGVPAEEIARQNHVPPPGQIHPGQVLVIIR